MAPGFVDYGPVTPEGLEGYVWAGLPSRARYPGVDGRYQPWVGF
ncbi:MAG TPA: hypothetical protein VIZ60_18155 [Rubrobacter sp.]